MPYKDPSIPSALQVFASEESVNSLLSSFLQVKDVSGWFNATEVPAGSKFNLTTGFIDKIFTGIASKYGDDKLVNVQFALTKLDNFTVKETSPDITLYADIELKFYVETGNDTELAVDITINNLEYQGQIAIVNNYNVSSNITKLQVHGITVNSCTFGHIGVLKLRMAMNVGLAVAAPVISNKIGTFHIPKTISGIFDLSDLIIKFYDGYIGVGATPTFIAPPLPPTPENSYNASKICISNKAGFVMDFKLKDKYSGVESDTTGRYPIDKSDCIDIKAVFPSVREGETIKTIVKAIWGKTNPT